MPRFKEGEKILIDATVLSVQGGKLQVYTRSKYEAFMIQRADARKVAPTGVAMSRLHDALETLALIGAEVVWRGDGEGET